MTTTINKIFLREDVKPLFKLALPLIVTGVMESSIGFFSTIFLSQLGPKDLAAGALVAWFFATLMVVLWGTLTAVSVTVAQKYGEKNHLAISLILRDAIILACLLVPPTFLLIWNIAPIFLLFGQSESLIGPAQSYLHGLAWGILPDFIWLVFLQLLIGLGHTRTSMTCMLLWIPIAIACNYILIFGKFGAPALGIAGIGWGMTLSYWLTTGWLILYLLIHPVYKKYLRDACALQQPSYLKEILLIGVPMGAMYCLEVGFFFALTLMMGVFGEAELAGNQIALQYLGIVMAVVFSLAQAVTVRMGHKIGAKDIDGAERTSHAGIFLALIFMMIALVFYCGFPTLLIAIDLNVHDPVNAEIIVYAKQFLMVCALFQLFEAARISLFGSLRALKDTNFTLITSVISFWLIALPLGYVMSHKALGPQGLWWGMFVGAICSSTLLFWRVKYKLRKLRHAHH